MNILDQGIRSEMPLSQDAGEQAMENDSQLPLYVMIISFASQIITKGK